MQQGTKRGGKLNFQEESKDRQLKGLKVSLIFLPELERLCKRRVWQRGCGLKSTVDIELIKAQLQAKIRILSNGPTYLLIREKTKRCLNEFKVD